MPNLFRNTRGYRWWPDADSVNAPEGALLKADNLVPDPEAMLALRAGSQIVHSGMQSDVHSLHTADILGKTYRFAGCDDRVYRNGVDFGTVFDGDGDIAMSDDSFQAFFARGKTKKKFDGANFYEWSIKAPEFPATLIGVTAITLTVADFNSSESPAFIINEGTGAFIAGEDQQPNGALQLTPDINSGRSTASKKFLADQDFLNILGSSGGDTDLFDFFVWMQEPRKVDKITIMFGLGTEADAYKDDYYYFDFPVRDAATVDVKDTKSTAAAATAIYANKVQTVLTPNEITNVRTPEQVTAVLRRLGRAVGPRSRERKDSQEASPAWTHLSVTRGQFNRVGGTSGRDWKTVRAFKVVYSAVPGSTEVVAFDSAVWTGGGNRSLTGRYQLGYRFVRNFNDQYFEMSPISPISAQIDLTQQALQVTIPASALAGKDPQVNQIWVYLQGGFLDTYYRFAIIPAVVQQGMTINELTNPAGSNFLTKSERTRLTSWGFTEILGGDDIAADLVFTIRISELEALVENETLEPGASGVPDNVVAIVGPVNNRMGVLTEEGRFYPSSQTSPSTFSVYHHLDLRRYGDPLWAVRTGSGIYVGMSKDVIRIAGTGDESDDKISVDLFPEPLHIGNPPVDKAVFTDGNAVIFRSADGLMLLAGASLTPITPAGTGLLWRGKDRHGVSSLNITHGRFRLAVDNQILFMLAPEGPFFSPPVSESEDVVWTSLLGFTAAGSTLTRVGTYPTIAHAVAAKRLLSGDGFVEFEVNAATAAVFSNTAVGLKTTVDSGSFPESMATGMLVQSGRIYVIEDGTYTLIKDWVAGDKMRTEVLGDQILYSINGVVVFTSLKKVVYPLVIDVVIQSGGLSVGPVTIQGNWDLTAKSSNVIWRYSFQRQQWSRTVYPVKFLSLNRDPDGAITAGGDDGSLTELEVGVQDNGQNIDFDLLTFIDDGGDPLARKDALDLQIHADSGGQEVTASIYLDGASLVAEEFPLTALGPQVFRANALDLGTFLKAQLQIEGAANKFLLQAFNLLYRNRVQQVMVLDTGTISPMGFNRLVWMREVEIDCISPVNLNLDIYLDDTLKSTQVITVLPFKRSSYRVEVPKGSKARAPRLVFRTTNANGVSNPGFEPYRVRIRERGTGTVTESNFRPVWPVGEAP